MPNAGWSSLLWFALIVVAIPFVLMLLKRTPFGAGAASGSMRVVGSLPLAPSQRVVTVEIGQGSDRRCLVLGVTAQNISILYSLPPQADAGAVPLPQPLPQPQPPFAQTLARLWSKPGNGDAR